MRIHSTKAVAVVSLCFHGKDGCFGTYLRALFGATCLVLRFVCALLFGYHAYPSSFQISREIVLGTIL